MTTPAVENLPAIGDDARDIPFFRTTAGLFTPEFCLGAAVLLVRYDGPVDTVQLTPAQPASSTTARVDTHTQPERDLIPVRVRRIRISATRQHLARSSRRNTIRTAPGQRR
jgi:hypothetical protein